MDAKSGIDGDVFDEAAAWFARRDAAPPSDADERAFAAWMADPAHRAAYAAVERVWREAGGMPHPIAPAAPRQGRAIAGLAIAASLLIAVVVALDMPTRWAADVMTATGETRTVTLADGTAVTLDTASALAVDYDAGRRGVRLLRGAAVFAVARDTARPFEVEAAGGLVRALGTEFVVRLEAGGALVTDLESRIGVSFPQSATPVTLSPGEQIAYASGNGLGAVATVDPGSVTAWRRGKLIVVDRPLGGVIRELNRYHVGTIKIVDPAIDQRRVSGVFEIHDPVAVVDSLEASLGLRSTRLSDYVILLHR
nr:FecR family protein [Rhodoplanes tepidamans]